MRALAAVAALSLTTGVTHADVPPQAEAPVIELVTIGRGASLFEAFGHAALCMRYVDDSQSACFNYGVTEYDRPGALIWNFIRGTQVFWSEASNYAATIESYREQDRDIWRQVIPATPAQARAIADRLWREADREHREYIYDHIANNCSTRLRDILDDELGHPLRATKGQPTSITIRAVGARGFADAPFILAVTDFVLGRPMEPTLDRWDAMFLPEMLRAEVTQRIGASPEVIAAREGPAYPTDPSPHGRIVFVVAALALALASWVTRRAAIAVVPLAFLGTVIWGLAIISPIGFVRWNEALVVLVPFDAAMLWMSERKRRTFASVRIAVLMLLVLASLVGLVRPLWVPIATALLPLLVLAMPPATESAVRDPDRRGSGDTGSS